MKNSNYTQAAPTWIIALTISIIVSAVVLMLIFGDTSTLGGY